jgi:uncharacterized protein (TIGR03435 family)
MIAAIIALYFSVASISIVAGAQTPKEFDVASIRLNKSGGESFNVSTSAGGRLIVKNITVNRLIQLAFDVRLPQVSAAPAWTEAERYDIAAKADTPERPALKDLNRWCQALLVSRFSLTFHWTTKELPGYLLVVAKGGPKLQPNADAPGPEISYGKGWIETSKTSVAEFASVLARSLEGNVVDNTGIKDVFDFKLRWTPDPLAAEPTVDPLGPSIFTALQEQCGLRAESRKVPVSVIVLDHIDRPSEN